MRELKAGIIGLGVGEQHIIGYDAHPHCRTVAICDIDAAKLAEVGARHPHCRQTTDPSDVFADPDIDIVSICSYDDAHGGQIVAALNAGKHVFVEKPLCVTRAELDAIRTAHARHPNLKLSSNLVLRRSPRFLDLRARIQAGDLGDLYLLEADYNYGRLHKLTEGWRGRVPNYSVMLGGGVHMIDLLLWLTGDRVEEVAAFGTGLATRDSAFQGDDTRIAILRFASGALGKIGANYPCVYPHHHKVAVYGTHATFENNVDGALLFKSRDPSVPPARIQTAYPGVAKHALIAGFIDSVLGQGAPDVEPEEIFACMDTCLRIDEAVAQSAD
ncbi:MAG: Gfo/Idh/MocA family oxidoreductase [Alphaproteobacteria bacterium]|nr:Gfo/Idh/MocA family oxidoreductase [Alphaproteobacteria bacterium]